MLANASDAQHVKTSCLVREIVISHAALEEIVRMLQLLKHSACNHSDMYSLNDVNDARSAGVGSDGQPG